jgi:hypothetical protein
LRAGPPEAPLSLTDAQTLRAFMSVLKENDVGVFVTLGGFTPDAELEARTEARRITLIGPNRLFELTPIYLAHRAGSVALAAFKRRARPLGTDAALATRALVGLRAALVEFGLWDLENFARQPFETLIRRSARTVAAVVPRRVRAVGRPLRHAGESTLADG